MPLKKVIEFPLFHVGQFTAQDGTPAPITEALLRQIEKNTNFILKSRILQAPIGYDHPAKNSDAHGTLVGARYHNGVLYAQGDNWSDTLVADVKASKRLAYSGEYAPDFTYPAGDGSGKMVKVGPALVGMAILGSTRPAIKNLKPLSEFGFAEGVSAADEYETREELRSAGMLSEYCEDARFFAEVENDARRFFSEQKEQESTMTDAEIQAAIAAGVKANLDTAVTAAVSAAVKPLQDQIKSFSETAKREADVHSFCEKVSKTRPQLSNPLTLERLEKKILLHPDMTPSLDAEIRAFCEGLSAVVLPGGVAGPGQGENDDTPTDEPKALAAVRPKHFADIDNPASQAVIDAAVTAFAEFKPDAFKGIEQNEAAQFAKVREYVINRDTATAAN